MLYNAKWDASAAAAALDPHLPAAALGLTERERAALVRVLAAMEADEMVHSPAFMPVPGGFNMSGLWYENECGTVGCIAGWADHLGGTNFIDNYGDKGWDDPLFQLFKGPAHRHNTTPAAAARALRAYLTTGRPDWS